MCYKFCGFRKHRPYLIPGIFFQIKSKIRSPPLDSDLDDVGVGEHLVERLQLTAKLEGVDNVVPLPGRDLHQTRQAQVSPVVVVLEKQNKNYQS